MQRRGAQFSTYGIHHSSLRNVEVDNLTAVVDGCPVQQCDILRIRLVHVVAFYLNQVAAPLEDSISATKQENTDHFGTNNITKTVNEINFAFFYCNQQTRTLLNCSSST